MVDGGGIMVNKNKSLFSSGTAKTKRTALNTEHPYITALLYVEIPDP
jgi:hypothetical protein